jgi:ribosomal protein S18 acetylase RimI-like enzyme
VHRKESYVWLQLALNGERERRALPEGVTLRRGTPADRSAIEQTDGPEPWRVEENLREGDLWIAEEPGAPVFSCWIFRRRTPMFGWTALPEGVVCLEHSATSAAARGRGVAPAAWSEIADGLQADGVRAMITKVRVENEPSLRAVGKAGFRETCRMHHIRTGPFERVRFEPPDEPLARDLSAAVERAR